MKSSMTFNEFRRVNAARQRLWIKAARKAPDSTFYAVGMVGEIGEVCAELENLRMCEYVGVGEPGDFRRNAATELADVFIYLDCFAHSRGLNLNTILEERFAPMSDDVPFTDFQLSDLRNIATIEMGQETKRKEHYLKRVDFAPWDWGLRLAKTAGKMMDTYKKVLRDEWELPGNKVDSPALYKLFREYFALVTVDIFKVANSVGQDLEPALVAKFNQVSQQMGFDAAMLDAAS